MEDWKNLSLSQLKRLAKGRAGRIAELQMEIRIIQGIMDAKIQSGDFGKTEREEPRKPVHRHEQKREQPKEAPKEPEKPQVQQPQSQPTQPNQEPLIRPSIQISQPQQTQQNLNQAPEQKTHPGFDNKENGKPKASNPHAFKEID